MRHVLRLLRTALVAAVATVALADPGHAAMCALPSEQVALNSRVLQSELMVAALTCGERKRYNTFVRKFENQLVAYGRALRQYFKRAHGSNGRYEIDRFVTRLANDASERSLATSTARFCTDAVSLFDRVLDVDSHGLRDFLDGHGSARIHGIPACTAEASRSEPR